MAKYTVIAWRSEGPDEYEVDRYVLTADSEKSAEKSVEDDLYRRDSYYEWITVAPYQEGDEYQSGPSH